MTSVLTRADLPRAAEARVLYAVLWDRRAADEARAILPGQAFAGRAAVVWALVCHHDDTHEPVFPPAPARVLTGAHEGGAGEPFDGPGRVLAILATALELADGHDDDLLSQAYRVAVREGALIEAVVSPTGPWSLDLATAHEVLRHAAVAAAAAYAVAALDAIAHHLQPQARLPEGTSPCPAPTPPAPGKS